MTASHMLSSIFANVLSRVMPALWTIPSNPPRLAAAAAIFSPASSAVISNVKVEPPISPATFCKSDCWAATSTQMTCAPSRDNTFAMASPIPRLAPVTTSVLSFKGFCQSTVTGLPSPTLTTCPDT